jgi:hypothetical protein
VEQKPQARRGPGLLTGSIISVLIVGIGLTIGVLISRTFEEPVAIDILAQATTPQPTMPAVTSGPVSAPGVERSVPRLPPTPVSLKQETTRKAPSSPGRSQIPKTPSSKPVEQSLAPVTLAPKAVTAPKPRVVAKAETKPEKSRPPKTAASPPPVKKLSPPPPVRVAKQPLPAPKPEPLPLRPGSEIYQAVSDAGSPMSPVSRIDELAFAKLQEKGITPAAPCSDGAFVRRIYLDVIGTLPTAAEVRAFLKDPNPNKRRLLIDRLLERPEFADYWAMKWGDILRVKSEFPINLWPNAVRAYHHWIRTAVRENWPYDQFARALLTSSGSNFRNPPVNFFRALQRKDGANSARAVALTFMGVRPESWPEERWSALTVFFARIGYKATLEWKEEIVFFDLRKAVAGEAVLPDGTKIALAPDLDPRYAFADWLITPRNPWFTRNIANRVWSWLLGRGIYHEADDLRPENPPSNPELMAYLEKELIAAHYDLKHLYRLILNSKTYQLSCLGVSVRPEAAALFASYPVRRLEAEVLIDAICQITGTTERYSSPIPEPFTYLPPGFRAVSLPDASITSPFLEMFGRPPRDSGLESERNNNFNAAQRLHLLNSSHIQQKIEHGPGLAGLLDSGKAPQELAEELYLRILSRYPTPEEVAGIAGHARTAQGRRLAVDIAWALINSAEFLCRH